MLKPLLWSLLAGVAIYGGSVFLSDSEVVRSSAAQLGWSTWSTILGLSILNYLLRFMRWHAFLGQLGYRPAPAIDLAYYLAALAFTTTPGKAGEAVRSLYLKRHGVTYVHSLAALFTERLQDLLAMTMLSLVAALTFPETRWLVALLMFLLLILLPLVHGNGLQDTLQRIAVRSAGERLRKLVGHGRDLLRSSARLLRSAPLYGGLGIGLLAWGAEGLAFHVLLVALNIDSSLPMAISIYAISVLAGAISFIPGGLGSTEAVMGLLLVLIGADPPTAVAATLICRLATLWFAVLLGGLVAVGLQLARAGIVDPEKRPGVEQWKI